MSNYLQAARIATGLTGEWTANVNHFVAEVVENVHLKVTNVPAPIACAAAAILGRVVNLLTDRILHNVLVISLVTSYH